MAWVTEALFSRWVLILVETEGTVQGRAVKAPGCRSDQIDLQDKPKAACQLAPSQVFLVTTLAGSDPQPGQTVSTAAPTRLARLGQGVQARLSGRSRVDVASPQFPGTALGRPGGPSHSQGFTACPLRVRGEASPPQEPERG